MWWNTTKGVWDGWKKEPTMPCTNNKEDGRRPSNDNGCHRLTFVSKRRLPTKTIVHILVLRKENNTQTRIIFPPCQCQKQKVVTFDRRKRRGNFIMWSTKRPAYGRAVNNWPHVCVRFVHVHTHYVLHTHTTHIHTCTTCTSLQHLNFFNPQP